MIDRTMTSEEFPDWFTDLLILRATDGLNEEQQEQFDQFVAEHPDRDRIELEAEKFELTVAAIDLSFQIKDAQNAASLMSVALRQKVLDGAKRHLPTELSVKVEAEKVSPKQNSGLTSREAFAWLVSAAAVIVLLTGWNPFAAPLAPVAEKDLKTDDTIEAVQSLSFEDQLSQFVNNAANNLTRIPWSATGSNSDPMGEVIWSDELQEGYMVFEGFTPNDPAKSQYQLWIFDTVATQKHPVDGGVFDISALQKRVIIPIDARIPIAKAVMFAITEEKPGGVVVSDREHLPLLAQIK